MKVCRNFLVDAMELIADDVARMLEAMLWLRGLEDGWCRRSKQFEAMEKL